MPVWSPSGSGNVHFDQILTQISLAWPNGMLVGERLFPTVPVRKQIDKYYVFGDKSAWVPEPQDIRAPGTEANEIPGMTVSLDSYYAQEHALQMAVTDEERENADSPLAPDRDATELLTAKILLGRELAMRDLVTATANYVSGLSVTLDVDGSTAGGFTYGKQWDLSGSTPIKDVRTANYAVYTKSFLWPTTAVIPLSVMNALEDSADLIERIKYSERAILTPELVATLLGLGQVVVPGVGYSNTNPGQATNVGFIWGDDVVMAYVPPRAGMRIPAYGYEFVWAYGGGTPQAVDRWREDRRKADLVRVGRRFDLKLVGVDSSGDSLTGFLFKDVLST